MNPSTPQRPAGAPTTADARVSADARGDRELRDAMSAWQAAVVRLDALDAVTTEVVRLRCATHHDCHT